MPSPSIVVVVVVVASRWQFVCHSQPASQLVSQLVSQLASQTTSHPLKYPIVFQGRFTYEREPATPTVVFETRECAPHRGREGTTSSFSRQRRKQKARKKERKQVTSSVDVRSCGSDEERL